MIAQKSITILVIFVLVILFSLSVGATPAFQAEETDLVRITPEGVDPDFDQIAYSYSAPFNEKGEWQTDYNDAGKYYANITASDGKDTTTKTILIVVKNKNRAPLLAESKIVVKETQLIDLKTLVEDPDGDPLLFTFKSPFDRQGRWQTNFGDQGTYVAMFTANDGTEKQEFRAEVLVLHTNQPPKITSTFSNLERVYLREDSVLQFSAKAADADQEKLAFIWELDGTEISTAKEGNYYVDYDRAGDHLLHLSVKDSSGALAEQKWTVKVENTNRVPQLNLVPLTVQEGQKVSLNLPEKDNDGDLIRYTYSKPLNASGEWQPNFDQAGRYRINITAVDWQNYSSGVITLNVVDVDRAPVVLTPKTVFAREGTPLVIKIDSTDLDGEKVKLSFAEVPSDAIFNENESTLTWTPPYSTITRPFGFISNIFNRWRIEQRLLREKNVPVTVTSCGKDLCTSKTFHIIVQNTNQAPRFTNISTLIIQETETGTLLPHAEDPDGDIVHYYFTEPLGKRSGRWETSFDSAGNHTIYVTATDGYNGTTIPVKVQVSNKNRNPSLNLNFEQVKVNEGQEFTLHATASDLDNDTIIVTLQNLPPGASFADGVFVWTPGYGYANKTSSWRNNVVSASPVLNRRFNTERTVQWLEFSASDGQSKTILPVPVTIVNSNRAPRLIDALPTTSATAAIGQPIVFHVVAKDDDGDTLDYTWNFGNLGESSVHGTNTIERTFTTPGEKTVKVAVSDGREQVEKEWIVMVSEERRPLPQPQPEPWPEIPFTMKVYVIKG